jgi:hypothetical protein
MGVYLLPGKVHQKIDSARANFFWDFGKKKHHMIKWEVMTSPKRFGGMGFTDTRLMNECPLSR